MSLTDELFERVERALADRAAHGARLAGVELVQGEISNLRSRMQSLSMLVTHFLVLDLTSAEFDEIADTLRSVSAGTEGVFRVITKISDTK